MKGVEKRPSYSIVYTVFFESAVVLCHMMIGEGA
jgi:phage-related protein